MASSNTSLLDIKFRDAFSHNIPPLSPKTNELSAGHRKQPTYRPLTTTTIFDHDQVLVLRDGTKIYADIFRPRIDQKVPAIVMWGPYGKTGTGMLNIHSMPLRAGIPESQLSGYEGFEGLDPAEWVPRGYAIVNVDPRGVNNSEGNIHFWGTQEGQDGHDAIEELAKLPWCSGKIAMAGNSWLAISQYFIAAEQPPHLTCIAPLEGLSDPVREETIRGGIANTAFSESIAAILPGRNKVEDYVAMLSTDAGLEHYLNDKRVDMTKIKVPAYIGASYSSPIHGIGSLRAFEEIPHQNKWLILHASQEWYDLYSPTRTSDLARFFDFHLKGLANEWPQTVPVRMALLNFSKPALLDQEFADLPWHLPDVTRQKLHLSSLGKLTHNKQQQLQEEVLEYQADSSDEISFTYTFSTKTVLTGPSTLVIDIAAPSHDDLDVHTHIFKADASGALLSHLNMPVPPSSSNSSPASTVETMTQNRIWRYLGPNGMLRASKRHVHGALRARTWETLSHEGEEKIKPGEVVRLRVQLWPTGIVFEAGEQLVLKISGREMGLRGLPQSPEPSNMNKGKHVLHFGRSSENYLEFFTL
ncbi:alpha beta-hydrolase [Alternaria burnsii]|uniref:Alpha beta-hydrolase n=1 Tax=Alternaria burnsii TaxID=1187904 RepID=A0A8H7E9Z2_9PLEO|nr:alpha beta-hydrolase [Alternaria burnsii]KAF7672005.1 alpha beta-hydrolase [Alternaria burnsii]